MSMENEPIVNNSAASDKVFENLPSGTAVKTEPAAPAKKPKIRTIVIDTVTAIQKNQVYEKWEDGKVTHDQWKDYGVDLVNFVRWLVSKGFTCVGVLGYEGTGKSFGMKTLPPGTNVWFNIDDKESTFKGGRQLYGTRNAPTYLMKIPKTYEDMQTAIERIEAVGMLDERPIAFLIGHVEDYTSKDAAGAEIRRQRLKTMGKISKNGFEDMLTMCYYTRVTAGVLGAPPVYELSTQNSGFNTARTMEQQHDKPFIPNDFNLIVQTFDNY